MRRLVAVLFLLTASAAAQSGTAVLIPFTGVPTGTCAPIMIAVNTSNADFYDCLSGSWNKVNSAAGGVTSVTGDGALISNSGSTGAVTLTIATAAAHKYWGNPTGSTAAPGYNSIVSADLPAALASQISINGLAITASTGTIAVTNAKTVSFSNTLTFAGTDSTTMTFPTTSATIARTDAANTFTGHQTIEGVTSTGATGTNLLVFATSPTLTTPVLGVATATSIAVGTSPPTCTPGTAGVFCMNEGTAPTAATAVSQIFSNSTTHELGGNTNGGGSGMLVMTRPSSIRSTGLTGAVSTATLCAASAGACNQAGQYHVHWTFYESGTACGTPGTGGVTFLLTWTDGNATAHSAISLSMDDGSSLVATTATFHFQTTLAAAWASGDFNIDTNGSIIQYATGYTACSVGTGTYALSASVTRLQ